MQSTRYSCHILMKHVFSLQILEICSNIQFNENSSELFNADGRTDTTKLIVFFFCNFANATKNGAEYSEC